MGLKSRDTQKAHPRPLPNAHTYFSFVAEFLGELCEEQTQKIRKPGQKTIPLGLKWGEIGSKSRDPQKAHLGNLLNVHT